MMFRKSLLLIVIVTSLPSGVNAQEATSSQITSGRELTLSVCGACHVVTKDQSDIPTLRNPGPSFVSIVNRPGFSIDVFRRYLNLKDPNLGPHQGMPNPELADYQIDEIVAYVMSLKVVSPAGR